MPNFAFHLFNVANTTREAVLGTVIAATEVEELIGIHTLSVTLVAYNNKGERILGASPEDDGQFGMAILATQKHIRVYDQADNSYRSFIIRRVGKNHDANNFTYDLHCEAKKMALLNQVVDVAKEYAQLSSDDFLDIVLGYASGFALGSNEIPAAELRNVVLAKPSILEALKYLHDTWTYESGGTHYRYYPIIAEDGTIDILREDNIGSDIDYPVSYLHGASRIAKIEQAPAANRVYFSGLGNDILYANNSKVFDETSMSPVFYGDPPYTRNLNCVGHFSDLVAVDSYVIVYLTFHVYWTGSGGSCEVQYRVRLQTSGGVTLYTQEGYSNVMGFPDSSDWLMIPFFIGECDSVAKVTLEIIGYRLGGGAAVSTVHGRIPYLFYEISPNASYVEDASSQATYGIVEYSGLNEQTPKLLNEFRATHRALGNTYHAPTSQDATFSGTYSGGLCNSLVAVGTNTFLENTNPLYVIHGSKSQYIENTAEGNGVSLPQPIWRRLVGGRSYMALFNFYIVEGSLHITITGTGGSPMLFDATTRGIGWVQLLSETPFGTDDPNGTRCEVAVVSASEGAKWYFDSVIIARCAEGIEFHKENSADALLTKANRILQNNKDPHTLYEIAAIDLSKLDIEYRDYQFGVGDRLRVFDSEARIVDTLRVFRRQRDLLDAYNMQVTLADLSASLAQIVNFAAVTPTLRGDI